MKSTLPLILALTAQIVINPISGGGGGTGGGAPTDAEYWVGAANGDLSAEKNLGVLGTGLVINTAGVPSAYTGASCTNQFPRSLNASGAATCESVAIASDVSGLGAGIATWLATPSSANLLAAVTNETGTGALVFATNPTISQITLGAATGVSLSAGSGIINEVGLTGNAESLSWDYASGTNTHVTITSLTGTTLIKSSTISAQFAGYNAADGSAGVTVASCTAFEQGICTAGTSPEFSLESRVLKLERELEELKARYNELLKLLGGSR